MIKTHNLSIIIHNKATYAKIIADIILHQVRIHIGCQYVVSQT